MTALLSRFPPVIAIAAAALAFGLMALVHSAGDQHLVYAVRGLPVMVQRNGLAIV
jgi:membrane protease YdiL (CAAX protease family)